MPHTKILKNRIPFPFPAIPTPGHFRSSLAIPGLSGFCVTDTKKNSHCLVSLSLSLWIQKCIIGSLIQTRQKDMLRNCFCTQLCEPNLCFSNVLLKQFRNWPIRKISSTRLFELMDTDWFPTLRTLSFGETVQMVHSEDIFQMVGQSLFSDQMALNSNVSRF